LHGPRNSLVVAPRIRSPCEGANSIGGLSGFVDYESVTGLDTVSSGLVTFGLRYQTSFR